MLKQKLNRKPEQKLPNVVQTSKRLINRNAVTIAIMREKFRKKEISIGRKRVVNAYITLYMYNIFYK